MEEKSCDDCPYKDDCTIDSYGTCYYDKEEY